MENTLVTGVNAVIAEDESILRAELRERLQQLWAELTISAEAADGVEAIRCCRQYSPQIVFRDIQVPRMDGLEVAQQIAGSCHIVFLTAHDEHAIKAFERGAFDYLQKPYSMTRLAATIHRLQSRLADSSNPLEEAQGVVATGSKFLKSVTVQRGHEIQLIATDEICYLRADNKSTSLFTPTAEYLLTSGLKQIKQKVDPQAFWQIHRRCCYGSSNTESCTSRFAAVWSIVHLRS